MHVLCPIQPFSPIWIIYAYWRKGSASPIAIIYTTGNLCFLDTNMELVVYCEQAESTRGTCSRDPARSNDRFWPNSNWLMPSFLTDKVYIYFLDLFSSWKIDSEMDYSSFSYDKTYFYTKPRSDKISMNCRLFLFYTFFFQGCPRLLRNAFDLKSTVVEVIKRWFFHFRNSGYPPSLSFLLKKLCHVLRELGLFWELLKWPKSSSMHHCLCLLFIKL